MNATYQTDPPRLALITGGARRLGRAIVLALADKGTDVIVHYGSSEAEAKAVCAEASALGVSAARVQADLTNPEDILAMFEAVDRLDGSLDLLVNNAASFESANLTETTAEMWDAALATNARAPFLCIQEAGRRMRKAATAKADPNIVNIVDLSGAAIWPGYAAHGVSKAGLSHLTRYAALELAPDIRVNAVCPGAILPPPGMSPEDRRWAEMGDAIPLGRTGDPEDICSAVLFLASSPFITGTVLHVDGGEQLSAALRY